MIKLYLGGGTKYDNNAVDQKEKKQGILVLFF